MDLLARFRAWLRANPIAQLPLEFVAASVDFPGPGDAPVERINADRVRPSSVSLEHRENAIGSQLHSWDHFMSRRDAHHQAVVHGLQKAHWVVTFSKKLSLCEHFFSPCPMMCMPISFSK